MLEFGLTEEVYGGEITETEWVKSNITYISFTLWW
jgi:hypothetical protein